MPVREMTPEEVQDWLGSGRVLFGARPPVSSTEKPTGSSESVDPRIRQEMLDAMNRSIEAGFRAQDAYQMELQRQSAFDGSQASASQAGDSQDAPAEQRNSTRRPAPEDGATDVR